jgi:RimJ/RimL family protein N-acetyltransferase
MRDTGTEKIPEIQTTRLTLRPPKASDVPMLNWLVNDLQVVRNLTAVGYPAPLAETYDFVERSRGSRTWVVCRGGPIGVVSTASHLGYWLGRPFWGQGYAREAGEAVVRHFFETTDEACLDSGFFTRNPASGSVLRALGFSKTDQRMADVRATGERLLMQNVSLGRSDWETTQDLRIETERLVILPLSYSDAPRLSDLLGDFAVNQMTYSIPCPFPIRKAQRWIAGRRYRGRSGFAAGVRLKGGPLIGFVGLGGSPANLAYALGRAYWGQGFATEAVSALLDHAVPRFGLREVEASAYVGNGASHRILRKLGFVETGRQSDANAARLVAAPLIDYRWTRTSSEDGT